MANKLVKVDEVLINDTKLTNEVVLCIGQFLLDYCNPKVVRDEYSNFYGIKCSAGTVIKIWAIEVRESWSGVLQYDCRFQTSDFEKYVLSCYPSSDSSGADVMIFDI